MLTTRAGAQPLTPALRPTLTSTADSTARRLEAVWPETAKRVQGYLRRRGLTATTAEDISQEVAIRVLRTGVAFADADDLVPWACTVGWRIHLAHLRKSKGREGSAELLDGPSTVNVEEEVIARTRVTQVMAAISTLSDRDRRALLATVMDIRPSDPSVLTPREAGRLAVVRHRARGRLSRALRTLGSLGTAVYGIARKFRWYLVGGAAGALVVAVTLAPVADRNPTIDVHRAGPSPRTVDSSAVTTAGGGHIAPVVAPISARTAGYRAPTASRAAPTTVIHVGRSWKATDTSVSRRPKRPTDHVLCTGSLILLPHACVG